MLCHSRQEIVEGSLKAEVINDHTPYVVHEFLRLCVHHIKIDLAGDPYIELAERPIGLQAKDAPWFWC